MTKLLRDDYGNKSEFISEGKAKRNCRLDSKSAIVEPRIFARVADQA